MFTQQQLDVIKNEAQMRAHTWLTTFQNAYYARPANMQAPAMMEQDALSMMEMPDGLQSSRWPLTPGRSPETEVPGGYEAAENPEE